MLWNYFVLPFHQVVPQHLPQTLPLAHLDICQLHNFPKVFSIIGDGENEEGAVWEMAQFAALHKLNNFIDIQFKFNIKELVNKDF
mgnify:CR=1 FL=1